jgi:DNA-binding response OmpR family regulator
MRQRRVLVVEDDPSISMGLALNLEKEGYIVHTASDGDAGLHAARTHKPDLIVLDVMMPGKNGFEVLDTLRREGYLMPIIILSAKSSEMDKVTGLELGAEDYVSKPFSLAELLARIRAALRRAAIANEANETAGHDYVFADVRIDFDKREVLRAGVSVEFTHTEFEVLVCFISSKGKVLAREDIFKHVWGENHHGTPRTVDNFIQQLRAKLEQDPQSPRHFLTVRGVGYRFDVGK